MLSGSLVAFVATADLDRAHSFYADTLGLPQVGRDRFASVFAVGDTVLRVTPVVGHRPVAHTVLGWHVDDISVAVDGLVAAGVVFRRFDGIDQDEREIWTAPGGDRVAWFTDLDGNVLSLTQFA